MLVQERVLQFICLYLHAVHAACPITHPHFSELSCVDTHFSSITGCVYTPQLEKYTHVAKTQQSYTNIGKPV